MSQVISRAPDKHAFTHSFLARLFSKKSRAIVIALVSCASACACGCACAWACAWASSENFNLGHNFWTRLDGHFIFGILEHHKKTHLLNGVISRSRSHSRSGVTKSVKFSNCNNFWTIADLHLIFYIQAHLKMALLLKGLMSRSRSLLRSKVTEKCQNQ